MQRRRRPVPGVAVVIPALNEAESVAAVVRSVLALGRWSTLVVVVDNGSADTTPSVAAAAGAEVVLQPIRGYGNAVAAGIAHLQRGVDLAGQTRPRPHVLVVLDADGADDIAALPRLVEPILEGRADFALGDRTGTADTGSLTTVQRLGNRLATTLIAASTGHRYRDMGPMRAIRWSLLTRLGMRDPTWGWNVEMQMRVVHHGGRILELDVPYRSRTHGRSKISGSISGALRAGFRILTSVHAYREPT
jgi:glycosyltransferase involved in cell wall biosynthesis